MMCLNSNDRLANTLKWTPWNWTHSIFICVLLLMISNVSTGVEFNFPIERVGLVEKDSNNLMNPNFLPFLNDCASANPTNRVLCATYYDMVYNVYQYDGNVADAVKAEIHTADQTLEKLGEQFCSLFPNEITQALDKRPFLNANQINLTAVFRSNTYCTINCLTMQDTTMKILIKPICKSISGGCKWILKQKRNAAPMDSNLQSIDAKINKNESTKLDEKSSVNNNFNSSFNGPIANSNNNNNNQDTNSAANVEATLNVNKEKNVEQIAQLKLNLNSSSIVNPIPNILNPIPMPDPNQIQNSNAVNASKSAEPAPQQAAQKDDKKSIDSTAPKSSENRPSTVSGNKLGQNKDTFTEQHEDNNVSDININQNENNVDENAYKNELEDPDKQEDDTEPGTCIRIVYSV